MHQAALVAQTLEVQIVVFGRARLPHHLGRLDRCALPAIAHTLLVRLGLAPDARHVHRPHLVGLGPPHGDLGHRGVVLHETHVAQVLVGAVAGARVILGRHPHPAPCLDAVDQQAVRAAESVEHHAAALAFFQAMLLAWILFSTGRLTSTNGVVSTFQPRGGIVPVMSRYRYAARHCCFSGLLNVRA